jgi:ABC-type sulfate/molybdate transport systems ATPase subunit
MSGAHVHLDRVTVEAAGARILDVAELDIPAGRTTAVLGPNGAGKSTLLRVAAGLRPTTSGAVILDGRGSRPAERRAVTAAVLQRPLLGRGSARRNAELGLRFARVRRAEARRRTDAWLARLDVLQLAERPARSLSGGEAQRISLARALVLEPRLLVLDEPFAPLDATTRAELLGELRRLLEEMQVTTLLVTHDPAEAAALAHNVAVLDAGKVRQQAATAELFAGPLDPPTARLLGYDNVLEPRDAARLGIQTARPIAFRAANLEVTRSNGDGNARVVQSIPVAGESRVVVDIGDASAVGVSPELGGLPARSNARARLATERCVPVGAAHAEQA